MSMHLSVKFIGAGMLLLILAGSLLIAGGKTNTVHPPEILDTCPQRMPFFLPDEIHETSGLAWYKGLLWTINDSGNDPLVYGIDPATGKINCVISIKNASNIDWEEISADANWMYVADVGNNAGTRRDLCIYRFPLNQITRDSFQVIVAEKIEFYYVDQHDFSSRIWHSPWDAEALIPDGDSLLILTKDWEHQSSVVYSLPNKPGRYPAIRNFNLRVKGLVTGASLDSTRNWLAICGYENYQPFLSLIPADSLHRFSEINLPLCSCDSLYGIQTEGVCFGPANTLYLSSESSLIPQSLFRYTLHP